VQVLVAPCRGKNALAVTTNLCHSNVLSMDTAQPSDRCDSPDFLRRSIGFKLLYGLVILRLERRRLVRTNVTANPTADWIARQITEEFPWGEAPRYLIRDRDTAYGVGVTGRLRAMGIRDRPITPCSPWQNGHVERLIGSILCDLQQCRAHESCARQGCSTLSGWKMVAASSRNVESRYSQMKISRSAFRNLSLAGADRFRTISRWRRNAISASRAACDLSSPTSNPPSSFKKSINLCERSPFRHSCQVG
jgi:hypothetical protein